MEQNQYPERISTGVPGLDEILLGGLIPNQSYLVRGGPGTGKTTLGLHFLAEGHRKGKKGLFITLGESEGPLRKMAKAIEPDMQEFSILDLSPSSDFFSEVKSYDIFTPGEVEREPITNAIIERIDEIKPERVFLDSMTQFRYLATDEFQFRKQVLSFLNFLLENGTTVLFTSEGSATNPDEDLQFLSDCILNLETAPEGLRTVDIAKYRGSGFRSGRHSLRLSNRGMQIFPRLMPDIHGRAFVAAPLSSGLPELDALLHGGLERGTITIISGPSGVGKTTLGLQFMKEAAGRGERSVVYSFEEDPTLTLLRCDNLSIPARAMIEQGTLSLVKIEPLQFTPDEFANVVRQEVEAQKTRIVMIDGTSGYRLSLSGENVVSHLHALGKYLQNMGVATILINERENISGEFQATELGISYLADNLLFIQYVERVLDGPIELRKAIGVLKKRLSGFERSLRELDMNQNGIVVGKPMLHLDHIIKGLPKWEPSAEKADK